jgi:hypothetical protein
MISELSLLTTTTTIIITIIIISKADLLNNRGQRSFACAIVVSLSKASTARPTRRRRLFQTFFIIFSLFFDDVSF